MNTKVKALLASYARSVLSAAVALYLAGVTDPVQLLSALAAGLLPVAIRYVNPKDAAFGRIAEEAVAAYLPKGEAVIPKEYLDKNKEAIENLVKAYNDASKKAKATAPKATKK
jgi:hypothetical protein